MSTNNETKVEAIGQSNSTESDANSNILFENLLSKIKRMIDSKLVHWAESIEQRTRQANDELEKRLLKLLTHEPSEDSDHSNHIDQIHAEGSSQIGAMQSDDVNDDEEHSKSKPMSIYYEATSDTSPENIVLEEMMDQTPAPLRRANRNYKQNVEDEDDEEMWRFCDEVSNRGTYGMTRRASDADGFLIKKNKSLCDAEVKGRKKEKALKFYAVKVGKKRGLGFSKGANLRLPWWHL